MRRILFTTSALPSRRLSRAFALFRAGRQHHLLVTKTIPRIATQPTLQGCSASLNILTHTLPCIDYLGLRVDAFDRGIGRYTSIPYARLSCVTFYGRNWTACR